MTTITTIADPRSPRRPVAPHADQPWLDDVERDPDGIPPAVIALTVVVSVMLAIAIAVVVSAGTTAERVGAVILGGTAVPILVSSLQGMATRGGDQVHPSR